MPGMFSVKRRLKRGGRRPRSGAGSDESSSRAATATKNNIRSCLRKTSAISDRSVGLSRSVGDRDSSKEESSSPTARKGVQFADIHIREFERIIGDNPSCSNGAPVAIGWGYGNERKFPLDEYEKVKPYKKSHQHLILSRQDREAILMEWGASFNQIIDAIRQNIKVKNQRRRTVNSIGTYDRWEEAMESAGRKLKKRLSLQKSSDDRFTSQKVASSAPPKLIEREESSNSESHEYQTVSDLTMPQSTRIEEESDDTDPATQTEDEENPLVDTDQRRLSYDSRRPISQIDVMGEDEHSELTEFPDDDLSFNSPDLDTFMTLRRHSPHWLVEGSDFPGIRRVDAPMVISEDGVLEDDALDGFDQWGFTRMQPPPFSSNIISQWE